MAESCMHNLGGITKTALVLEMNWTPDGDNHESFHWGKSPAQVLFPGTFNSEAQREHDVSGWPLAPNFTVLLGQKKFVQSIFIPSMNESTSVSLPFLMYVCMHCHIYMYI